MSYYDEDYDYIDQHGNPAFYTEREILEMEAAFDEEQFALEEEIDHLLEQEDHDRELAELDREDDGWQPSVIVEGFKWMDENYEELRTLPSFQSLNTQDV